MYVIRRDGNIVKHVVFKGNDKDLYKEKEVIPLILKTEKETIEVNNVLKGEIELANEELLKSVS